MATDELPHPRPSSGKKIRSLGILSIVLMILTPVLFASGSIPVGFLGILATIVLAIITLVKGSTERWNIKKGFVEPTGKGPATSGMIIAGFSLVITVVVSGTVVLALFTSSSIIGPRDNMVSDMQNIAANAYQHKIRPASMQGGEGCYEGYTMPPRMAENENGSYRVVSMTCSTIVIEGIQPRFPQNTIRMTVGPDGYPSGWEYGGDFR